MEAWSAVYDEDSNQYYYFNSETNETTWEMPPGFDQPGAPADQTDEVNVLYTEGDEYNEEITNPWVEMVDDESGRVYYYNQTTGESAWENPNTVVNVIEIQENESSEWSSEGYEYKSTWVEAYDDSGTVYYYNELTGESSWTNPEIVVTEEKEETTVKPSQIKSKASKNSKKTKPETESKNEAWSEHYDNKSRKTFLENNVTLETKWIEPVKEDPPSTSTSNLKSRIHSFLLAPETFEKSLEDQNESKSEKTKQESISSEETPETNELNPAEKEALKALDEIKPEMSPTKVSNLILSISDLLLDSENIINCLIRKLDSFSLSTYAEKYFHYDRRGQHSHINPIEKLLSFHPEQLKTSLTSLSSSTLSADAVICFRLLLSFMGDKKSDQPRIELASNLLFKLLSAPGELHDEVFCQLCKQTRKNPSNDSLELGWQLMLICLSSVPPSPRILPYLFNYISSCVDSVTENANKFVKLSLKMILRSASTAVRKELPTRSEVQALLLGETVEITVDTLDGLKYKFPVSSYTTIKRLELQVCERLAILKENFSLFALFEVNDDNGASSTSVSPQDTPTFNIRKSTSTDGFEEQKKSERVPAGEERVLDLLAFWQRNSNSVIPTPPIQSPISPSFVSHKKRQKPQSSSSVAAPSMGVFRLLFKARYIYRITDHTLDPICARLLFAQAHHDVVRALYPHTVDDGIVLAALRLQEALGDYKSVVSAMNEAKSIVSKSDSWQSPRLQRYKQIEKKKTHRNDELNEIFETHFPLHKLISPIFLENKKYTQEMLEGRILSIYKTLHGVSKLEARKMFMSFISCWKFYGATFFIVAGHINGNLGSLSEIVLSVSSNSLILIDPETMFFLAEYRYEEIFSWGHSFDSFVLVLGTTSNQIKSHFKTVQGKEIDNLLGIYYKHAKEVNSE